MKKRKPWSCVIGRHHYHNLGEIERARCGGTLRYEWECCICGKRVRSSSKYSAGLGVFAMPVSVDPEDERQRKAAL